MMGRLLLLVVIAVATTSSLSLAAPVETRVASRFAVMVPPNNDNNGRSSAIVVTAMHGTAQDPTYVDLVDDAGDGDDDDTQLGVALTKGQSLVRYIKDGDVNDDAGGVWDGDFMTVDASQPVTVLLVTDSDWQHDWAPSSNGTLSGREFFLYTNKTTQTARDVDVFAYSDDTVVELHRVSSAPTIGSGVTVVDTEEVLLKTTLQRGQSLRGELGAASLDLLQAGHTFRVVTTRDVTVLVGALGGLNYDTGVRDGGGFVPGRHGQSIDDDFYFRIPHDRGRTSEKELRVVSAQDSVTVTVEGYNDTTESFDVIDTFVLDHLEHYDLVGDADHDTYHLSTSGGKVVVFEANWLETGSFGTSDIASFAPGFYDDTGAADFMVYVGPPGHQHRTRFNSVFNGIADGTFAHVLLFAEQETTAIVVDADTQGTLFGDPNTALVVPAGGYLDIPVSTTDWSALNRPSEGIRPYLDIHSSGPISVCMANFNDNWMAYASSVQVRDPTLTLSLPQERQPGDELRARGTIVLDSSEPLRDVVLTLTFPAETSVFTGVLDGAAPTETRLLDDGRTQVVFERALLQPSAPLAFDVTAGIRDDTTPHTLLLVDAVVEGVDSLGSRSSGASGSVFVAAPLLDVRDFAVTSANRGATVSMQLRTADVAQLSTVDVEVRRDGTLVGVFATSVGADWTSVSWADAGLNVGQRYTYTATLVHPQSRDVLAVLGPLSVKADSGAPPPAPTLTGVDDGQALVLSCTPSGATDVTVTVQRAPAGSTQWTTLDTVAAGVDVRDAQAPAGIRFDYRCRASNVDGAGPWSATTTLLRAPVGTVEHNALLRYEDMIGEGENDWDYNDFVAEVRAFIAVDDTRVTELTIVVVPLARGAGYIHSFRLRLPLSSGHYSATRTLLGDAPAPLTTSGTGAVDVALYDDTRDALPPVFGAYTNTPIDQASFVPGTPVMLEVSWSPGEGPLVDALGAFPWDFHLHLPYLETPNEVHLAQHQGATERTTQLPGFPDAVLPFVLVEDAPLAPLWSFEGRAVWLDFPAFFDTHDTAAPFVSDDVSPGVVFHTGR